MFLKFSKLFYPEEAVETSKEEKELSKEEVVDLLAEDIEEEPLKLDKEKGKEEEKEEDEDDELTEIEKELEEDLEDVDEDKLELVAPVSRSAILKEFPELYKKFPYIEKSMYRDKQFSEMFATPADAKEVVDKANILDQFDADLSKGNLETALRAVKNSGEKSFNKLVDDYLPNLSKIDKDAYLHVAGNIIKTTIASMINEAKDSNNEDLAAAAKILNHHVFGTSTITNPSNLSKQESKDDDKNEELSRREQEFLQKKFEDAKETLTSKVDRTLKSTISAYIDPKESMTDYVRKNASRDCLERMEELLEKDTRLNTLIDKLWIKASEDNFSRTSLSRIESTYLSRAKTVLPALIKQARIEALKGSSRRVQEDDSPQKKGPVPVGRAVSQRPVSSKSDKEKAKEIPEGMTTLDYLMAED